MNATDAGITLRAVNARRPAVFVDRDGTLTDEVGYVNHPRRLRLLPRSAAAIRRLNEADVPVVLVTNQSGIAKGYFSPEVLEVVHATLEAQLRAEGARLDGVYTCTHHPSEGEPPFRTDCDCRKPKPGLLRRAATEMGLDLRRSWMIGDKPSDLAAATPVGAQPVLVLTGYGLGEWEYHRARFAVTPAYVADDLLDAVEWILASRAAR